MRELFTTLLEKLDRQKLMQNVETLWRLELPQTFKAYEASATQSLSFLKEAGFKDAEIINFPADGKTSYQDKQMPMAWNVSKGRLEIIESSEPFDDPVIADYQRHPFELVRGSVSTVESGAYVRIITEAQMRQGIEAVGALVLCDPETLPEMEILREVLDQGAIGMITAYDYHSMSKNQDECRIRNEYRQDTSDTVFWINNCTEGNHWHVQCDDRPFTCFSISAKRGRKLRKALNTGEVKALIECDGVRSEGHLPAVTGLLPGKREKELWLFAHLFEPLSDDNATGVVGAIEILKAIKQLRDNGEIPELEFSIRVIFTSEMYGFAAYAESVDGALADRAIGAINLDSLMSGNPGQQLHVFLAPPGSPFFGNYLMEMLVDACSEKNAMITLHENGAYGDDTFLNDSSTGLSTVWVIGKGKHFWHNSILTMDTIDVDTLSRICAFIGSWVTIVVTTNSQNMSMQVEKAYSYALDHLNAEYRRIVLKLEHSRYRQGTDLQEDIRAQIEHRLKIDCARIKDFRKIADKPVINSVIQRLEKEAERFIAQLSELTASVSFSQIHPVNDWFKGLDLMIPQRLTLGFPHDLVKVPKEQRRRLPDAIMYGPLARILSNMDGEKSLQRLIKEAEWEDHTLYSEEQIEQYVDAIEYLAHHGYISLRN